MLGDHLGTSLSLPRYIQSLIPFHPLRSPDRDWPRSGDQCNWRSWRLWAGAREQLGYQMSHCQWPIFSCQTSHTVYPKQSWGQAFQKTPPKRRYPASFISWESQNHWLKTSASSTDSSAVGPVRVRLEWQDSCGREHRIQHQDRHSQTMSLQPRNSFRRFVKSTESSGCSCFSLWARIMPDMPVPMQTTRRLGSSKAYWPGFILIVSLQHMKEFVGWHGDAHQWRFFVFFPPSLSVSYPTLHCM